MAVRRAHPNEPYCGWCGRAKFSYSSIKAIREQLGEPEGYAPCANPRCVLVQRRRVYREHHAKRP